MKRARTVTIAGQELTREHALRFEVVRDVLTGRMALDKGARRLDMPAAELSQLVEGARAAVIRVLGEVALEEARAQLDGDHAQPVWI